MTNEILNIFYNEVIIEASKGKVEVDFTYNVTFDTIIENNRITKNEISNNNIYMPTLIIKDKKKFNILLLHYMKKAMDFYKESFIKNYINLNSSDIKHDYIKTLLTLLWSNATNIDFINPDKYLAERSDFFESDLKINKEPIYTSIGDLKINICKDNVINETPYYLYFTIDNELLPLVKFGISNNKAYIYAIQNKTNERNKALNRKMYKVNKGFDNKKPMDNISNPENLSGITPSTLISATLALSIFKANAIDEIIIPTFLPVRWNAKEIATDRKSKLIKNDREKESFITENQENHEQLQRNLSDKFIRTFRRLEYHFENINITAFPFSEDENMKLNINDNIICNNPLLEELYKSINKSKKK